MSADEEVAQATLAAVRALLTEAVRLRQEFNDHAESFKARLDAIDAKLVDALKPLPKLN